MSFLTLKMDALVGVSTKVNTNLTKLVGITERRCERESAHCQRNDSPLVKDNKKGNQQQSSSKRKRRSP